MKHPNKSTPRNIALKAKTPFTQITQGTDKHPEDKARVHESQLGSYVISGEIRLSLR